MMFYVFNILQLICDFGILLRIFLCFSGMLLLQDALLISFNLVLFKSLLIGKFNGVLDLSN